MCSFKHECVFMRFRCVLYSSRTLVNCAFNVCQRILGGRTVSVFVCVETVDCIIDKKKNNNKRLETVKTDALFLLSSCTYCLT